ncbi:hypothetical protein BC629DRAFT_1626864, partial [Irpex lacteus]
RSKTTCPIPSKYLSILRRAQQLSAYTPVTLALHGSRQRFHDDCRIYTKRQHFLPYRPPSLPASLNTTQDEPERGNQSERSTPARSPRDLTCSRTPTRGGSRYVSVSYMRRDHSFAHISPPPKCVAFDERNVTRSVWTATRARRAKAGAHAAKYTQLARPSTHSSSTATHPSTTSTSSRAGIRSGPSTMFCTRRIDPCSPYGTDSSTPYPSRPPSSMMSALPGSTTWACLA